MEDLPTIEKNASRSKMELSICLNRIIEAVAGMTSQKWLAASILLIPNSTNSLKFDRKKRKTSCLNAFSTECSKCNWIDWGDKIKKFPSQLTKSSANNRNLENVFVVFVGKNIELESQAIPNQKQQKSTFDLYVNSWSYFMDELIK